MESRFSVILRSHNDAPFVRRTLTALLSQDAGDFEIIICDDRSTDGTDALERELLGDRARYLTPPEGAYFPGRTLNRAAEAAQGEILLFNNMDCVIQGTNWLSALTLPFSDPRVCAAFAAQIPRPDAVPMVAHDYAQAFGDGSRSRAWRHFFSMASSAVRRDLMLAHPFSEEIHYSEDIEWTWRMRRLGHEIRYVPEAVAEHSHNYPPNILRKRFYNEGLADAVIFGDRPRFTRALLRILLATARDWRQDLRDGHFPTLLQAPLYRWRQIWCHEQGLRDCHAKGYERAYQEGPQ